MAPMTRCMADDQLVPTEAMAAYYARRAPVGLIISEAAIIRPDAQGYPNTPGIFTDDQIAGWKQVGQQVHQAGGKLFLQIWHTGRIAHSHFSGQQNVAPSALAAEGTLPRMRELSYETPKALSKEDIKQLVEDYAQAAVNTVEKAGLDGIEIHGANGYLVDQFLHYDTNHRDDEYGGTSENMTRFALEVVDAIIEKIGSDRTGLRISPGAYFGLKGDPRDRQVFEYLLIELEKRNIAYLHIGIFDDDMQFDYLDGRASDFVRQRYNGTLVGVGQFTPDSACKAIDDNRMDLIAIGRPLIANQDYMDKLANQIPMTDYSEEMLTELV